MPRKLFGLGSGTPSRFPYEDRPQSGPGIGASSGQNLRARTLTIIDVPGSGIFGPDFILNAQGAFWYNGVEGANTLSVSVVPGNALVQDPFGNWAPPGVSRYVYNAGIPQATVYQDFQGVTSVYVGPAMNGANPPYTLITGVISITASASPAVVVVTITGNIQATNGTPANPTLVTTDTWQTITSFSNGWTSNGQCRVQLLASGLVKLQLNVNAGVIATGTTICTVPAADYDPAGASQFLDCQTRGGTAMVNGPGVQITTGGNIQAEGLPTSTTGIRVNGDYALD